jgi:hypothetical protein
MNRNHLAIALAALLPLAACGDRQPQPQPDASTDAAADNDEPGSLLGRHVKKALAEARKELRTKNISIGDGININVGGHRIHRGDSGLPRAEITPHGDLLIEGKAVAVTPAQRRQLLDYRSRIIALAEAGMAIGGKGADLAGEALGGVMTAIFGGKDGEQAFRERMEAEGHKMEAEALKLCATLPPLLASQQALASSLPAFKPYATMTRDDIDDCRKEVRKSIVVTSDEDRREVRDNVRDAVRDGVRAAVRHDSDADTDPDAAREAEAAGR